MSSSKDLEIAQREIQQALAHSKKAISSLALAIEADDLSEAYRHVLRKVKKKLHWVEKASEMVGDASVQKDSKSTPSGRPTRILMKIVDPNLSGHTIATGFDPAIHLVYTHDAGFEVCHIVGLEFPKGTDGKLRVRVFRPGGTPDLFSGDFIQVSEFQKTKMPDLRAYPVLVSPNTTVVVLWDPGGCKFPEEISLVIEPLYPASW
jgi:hypothetical protein